MIGDYNMQTGALEVQRAGQRWRGLRSRKKAFGHGGKQKKTGRSRQKRLTDAHSGVPGGTPTLKFHIICPRTTILPAERRAVNGGRDRQPRTIAEGAKAGRSDVYGEIGGIRTLASRKYEVLEKQTVG